MFILYKIIVNQIENNRMNEMICYLNGVTDEVVGLTLLDAIELEGTLADVIGKFADSCLVSDCCCCCACSAGGGGGNGVE